MNQILVTEKLYVTPELKRKKKAYKLYLVLAIFLVIILTSIYIYAEYDRSKSEEVSSKILEEMDAELADIENPLASDNDVLKVLLNGTVEEYEELEKTKEETSVSKLVKKATYKTSPEGFKYKTIATVTIPKIDLKYPIIQGKTGSENETESLLKISPVKYHGSDPNEVGNFCVVGHNYRNELFFSKVPTLKKGDKIKIKDLSKRTITYEIYEKHIVKPKDTSDTTQLTRGKKEVTLITCTDDSKQRVVVRCKEVK